MRLIAAVTAVAGVALLGAAHPPAASAQDFLLAARAAAERGQMDSAYTLLDRAARAEPDRAEAHSWLAQVAGTRAGHSGIVSGFFLAKKAKR